MEVSKQVKVNTVRGKVEDRIIVLDQHMKAVREFWNKPDVMMAHIAYMRGANYQLQNHLDALEAECKLLLEEKQHFLMDGESITD